MHELAPRRPVARRVWLMVLLVMSMLVLLGLNFPARSQALADRTQQTATSTFFELRNRILGPPVVGVQIGHLDAQEHAEELASLRVSTGGYGGGHFEVDVNRAVASALVERLRTRDIQVELLPATIPPNYRADLFISLHADSSPAAHRRGYKSAVFSPRRNRWDAVLKEHVDEAYLSGSTLPSDDRNVTSDMFEYYAFNPHYRHSLARRTPGVIVEMGYLSHPLDLRLLERPDRVAALLEEGILAFLEERGRLR